MPYRKNMLITNEVYHVFTKSIAGYKIFNSDNDFLRMVKTVQFYSIDNPPCRFSWYAEKDDEAAIADLLQDKNKLIDIIAYCLMPTHVHFVLVPLKENGISKFMNIVLKSYSKYFNVKYKRKGPLWEGRFKNVLVDSDEQLLHLTRYVHLNPVSAHIVDNPMDWKFSSYREYVEKYEEGRKICHYQNYLESNEDVYRKFVEEYIDEQRLLEKIKHIIFE